MKSCYNATMVWQRSARLLIRLMGAILVVLSLGTPAVAMSACAGGVCDSRCDMHLVREPESCCPETSIAKQSPCRDCNCIRAPMERSADLDLVTPWSVPIPVCVPDPIPATEPKRIDLTSTRQIIAFADGSPPSVPKSPPSGRAPPSLRGLLLASRA